MQTDGKFRRFCFIHATIQEDYSNFRGQKDLFLQLGTLNNVPNFLDGEAIIPHRVGVLEEYREDGTKTLGLARQKVEDGLVS